MPSEGTIKAMLEDQRAYFASGQTLPVQARIQALDNLERAILHHEDALYQALQMDLGKSRTEAYLCEVSLTLSELRYVRKHVKRWSGRQWVPSALAQLPGRASILPEPYGVALILSPWNYPVLLTLEPLIGALAAGNCAVVKPSAYSPHTSAVLAALIGEALPPEHAAVVEGGRQENQCLLEQSFDYIFFTGSVAVGREVMTKAAAHLTPVTLELGGKSPCMVDETADLTVAARRIVFGKFLNCGQTCVAPDYVLVSQSVKEKFLSEIVCEIGRMYGPDPLQNLSYGKIINQKHFMRLASLLDREKVVVGGGCDPERLRIAPTVLVEPAEGSPLVEEEIFGPLLPVLPYRSLPELLDEQRQKPRPLALYLFTRSRETERAVLGGLTYGGGCVNDTIVHLTDPRLPFGGVGNSGMGACHGKAGFDAFTHWKSVLKKGRLDLPLRYPPYGEDKLRKLKKFM